jgi:hypothetical protein
MRSHLVDAFHHNLMLADAALADLQQAGLMIETVNRFSALSWGICVAKPLAV